LNTSAWQNLPRTRLLADVSLWSADLANLAAGIERVEPFADSFHLDVSDAHFAPSLLFFPDLIRALRPHTKRPLHIHLMVERPTIMLENLVASGADVITVHAEVGKSEATAAIEAILRAGRSAGLALRLDTPVAASEPYLDRVDSLLLLGTGLGVKGQDLAPDACDRLASAASLLGEPARTCPFDRRWRHPFPIPCLFCAAREPMSLCLGRSYSIRRIWSKLFPGCARSSRIYL